MNPSFYLIVMLYLASTHSVYSQKLFNSNWRLGFTSNYLQNSIQTASKDGPPGSNLAGINAQRGWTAGLFVEKQIDVRWRFRGNLQYSKQGFDDANSRGGGLVLASKHTLHYAQADALLDFSPFWRYPVGLTVFAGPVLQFTKGYDAMLFAVKPVPPPNPPFYVSEWETSKIPFDGIKISPHVIGAKVGVAYQYKQLGLQLSYQRMVSPALVENKNWSFNYQFSSLQIGLSYCLIDF